MLRKIALGLIAAASLSVAAIAPASAHGMHGGGGWGHHGGWGHGFGGLYINAGVSDCHQQQLVQTRFGLRLRAINVCGYTIY
jgi:hypothetical protein